MMRHEFYGMYANVPLPDRKAYVLMADGGLYTLDEIFKEVSEADDKQRKLDTTIDALVNDAAEFILSHQAMSPGYQGKQ